MKGGSIDKAKLCVPSVLLLFGSYVRGIEKEWEYTFVHHTEYNPPADIVNEVLGRARL